jgi:hypothetical protein
MAQDHNHITKNVWQYNISKNENQGEVDQGLPLCYNCGVTGQVLSRPANIPVAWIHLNAIFMRQYLTGENQADRELPLSQ